MDTLCAPLDDAAVIALRKVDKAGEILPLTSLRFLAALHVVLFHVWGIYMPSSSETRYWNDFVGLGYIGVSIFFILSGYILTTVYLPLDASPRLDRRRFFHARFARIYPVYALALILFAPFEMMNLGVHSLSYRIVKFAGLCAANFGMIQAWHPALGGGWNQPAWSVSAEAFFYLCFPFIGIAVATKVRRPLRLALLLWLASVAASLILIYAANPAAFPHNDPKYPRFNPLLRLPEFMIGICVAHWKHPVLPRSLSWASLLVYLGLIPLLAHLPTFLVSNGLLAPIFVALILGLGKLDGPLERLLSSTSLVALGHASYSLYLLHFPVLFWLTWLLRKLGAENLAGVGVPTPHDGSPVILGAYLLISITVSLMSYNLVEKPARHLLLKRLNRTA